MRSAPLSDLGNHGLVLSKRRNMYAVRKPRENGRDETMNNLVARVKQWHDQFFALVYYLQSPFLLFVRLYWGFQLAQSGWGKLHHLPNVTEYFGSLGLPRPSQMAVFCAFVEFFCGSFLASCLLSRITSPLVRLHPSRSY